MANDLQNHDREQGNAPARGSELAGQLAALKRRIAYFGGTALPTTGIFACMGAGWGSIGVGIGAGLIASYFSPELHTALGPGLHTLRDLIIYLNRNHSGRRVHALLDKEWWLTGRVSPRYAPPLEENEENTVEGTIEEASLLKDTLSSLFQAPDVSATGGIVRLTVKQIVKHTERNSYRIWIGRSLTREKNPAVLITIYKQHFRFMGASQRGKSSMVAAFLDIVTQTHDPHHVRLVLLDKEDQTSNLFAHLPHVLSRKRSDGSLERLHARTDDQVLEYLIHCVRIMQHRYAMPKSQVLELPIILVYIEEFLALKNEFKARIERAKTKGAEALAKAQSDYATLVYCIEELAQRGLKARVQLLLCAQVEYADDDFKEALVNVGCGFSFCVRPTAAAAAGFRNTELLKRNAKDNKVGQAVVECPDCNDLVLAPDYDLEHRLLAFEKAHPDIYADRPAGNTEMPIYEPEQTCVNGFPGNTMPSPEKPHFQLLKNEAPEHKEAEDSAGNKNGNVSDEVKEIIKRLHAQGVMKHNQIAKAVKLDGRKYELYRQVCRELGITIEREA